MTISLLAALCIMICSVNANANVPDPDMCSVTPCDTFMGMIVYPQPVAGGAAEFTVSVYDGQGMPFPAAFVEIIFTNPGNHFFCDDAVFTGTTNANGEATFAVSGGGCTIASDAVLVRANGVDIRVYGNVKSPDFAPGPDGNVDIGDFIYFGTKLSSGEAGCTDYYNAGVTGLGSFIVFGEAWTHICPD